jgi:hypothetical protein
MYLLLNRMILFPMLACYIPISMISSIPRLLAIYFLLVALAFGVIAYVVPDKFEDLLVAFFGAAFGGFLGIGAALYVYQRQTEDTIAAEQQAIQQRRIDHIRWLSGILLQVINYATNQATEMEALVAEMVKEPSEVHQLGIIANSSIERLTRADNEATFHAYNTIFADDPDRDKHYGELLGITDFLAASVAQVHKSFQGYLKNLYERQLRIKSMLEQAANDLATLKLSMDFGGPNVHEFNTPFYKKTNQGLLVYTSLVVRLRPMKELVADFVNPMLQVLVDNPHFPGANDLTMKLKDINVAFTDLKRESEHSQQAFNPNKLREPAGRVETVRSRLENGIRSAESVLNKQAPTVS